jgi:tetratricopeptide (TPR) repeat protein
MACVKTSLVCGIASLLLSATLSLMPATATCGGGGGGGDGGMSGQKVFTVPWQRLGLTATAPKGSLIVYWFPANPAEYESSTLRASRILAVWGSRCMPMCVLDPKSDIGQKFTADKAKLPLVVLASSDNNELARVDSDVAPVTVGQVEQVVTTEIRKRSQELRTKIDDAKSKVDSGDKDGAISEFKDVIQQKCLFPLPAREAVRELKKLGVDDVSEVIPAEPKLDDATTAKIQQVMLDGLKAENDADYKRAERLYQEANRMDPSDPAPLRYLGELNRHHLGNWDKAAGLFQQILAMDSDPLSRAVALHGLGKMTIHSGEFKKGLAMMEESVKVYPLAMTYRNLAVYWNSEGDSAKSDEYTRKALEVDPKDPYNVVFAAVFLAGNGHTEEALKVAHEHEDLLPASYNLAAIYAQSGQKDKALALLKRHFYQYERYKSVRAKEMMEARVDRVFDSLMKDPAFLALTADADGRLPMRGSMSR